MKKLTKLFVLCAFAGLVACGDDDGTTDVDMTTGADMTTGGDMTTGDDMTTGNDMTTGGDMATNFPAAPALGAQIDRAGRAAVSTGTIGAFTPTADDDGAMKAAQKDAYNTDDGGPGAWITNHAAAIAASVAIIDGIDGQCGLDAMDGEGATIAYGALENPAYTTIAAVLADDRLFVNGASGTCNLYLGVEAGVLGVANDSCGGRTPNYDVMDITYTVLVNGPASVAAGMPAVSDGITDDQTHSDTAFPFFAAPTM